MADLGEIMGALLASVAQARRIADEETASLAEYYRQNPLLEGMSLPRVRLPEVVLDLPVLVDDYREVTEQVQARPENVKKDLVAEMTEVAEEAGIKLPKLFMARFEHELDVATSRFQGPKAAPFSAESLAREVESGFLRVLHGDKVKRFSDAQARTAQARLRRRTREVAVEHGGRPPGMDVTVVTGEVKEAGSPTSVTRLRLTLREEGLEWTKVEQPDGAVRHTLTPE